MVSKTRFSSFGSLLITLSCLWAPACGGASDGGRIQSHVSAGTTPLLESIEPAEASPGETVRLVGIDFSVVAQENVVVAGAESTVATSYSVTKDSQEILTFEVPPSLETGETSVLVVVGSEVSNSLDFTVSP